MLAEAWIKTIVWLALLAVLLFWPAGTLAYPGGWGFLALITTGGAALTARLAKHSPSLLRERMASPVQRDQKPWDRVWALLFVAVFLGWLAGMAYDAGRGGFAAVPAWLQILGGLVAALYVPGSWWVFRENAFAAPVVKIQPGQRAIDSGPYAHVRHPMYASAVFFFAGTPLLLGSWWGLIGAALLVAGLAWRAVHEEETLRTELPGYAAYMSRVCYRLIPKVW